MAQLASIYRRFKYSTAGPPKGVVKVRTAPPSIAFADTGVPFLMLNHSTEKLPGASLRFNVNSPWLPDWKTRYSLPRSAKQYFVCDKASAGTVAARFIFSA